MSTAIAKNFQIGADSTPTNNFTLYQPASPDGTLRLGNGNTGITSSLLTLNSAGQIALVAGSAAAPTLSPSGDSNTGIFFPAADTIAFAEGGVEAMRLDASGNIGVGNTPIPNTRIYVRTAATAGSAFYADNGVNTGFAINFASTLTSIGNDFGNPLAFITGNTERARIDSSGNFGIGTSSPFAALAVNRAQGGASTIIGVQNDGTAGASTKAGFGFYDGGALRAALIRTRDGGASPISLETYDTVPLVFGTNNTERARIDSSGALLVGTTSSSSLHNTLNTGFQYFPGSWLSISASNEPVLLTIQNSTAFTRFYFRNTGQVGSISYNGSGVNYNTTSDYRLKEDVQPMTGALEKVAALKPCTYKWKTTGEQVEGFIAHELFEVCPQAVTGEKDAVNEDGSIKPQGIDTSFLVATLTAAIQELKAEFDAYKATHP